MLMFLLSSQNAQPNCSVCADHTASLTEDTVNVASLPKSSFTLMMMMKLPILLCAEKLES